MRTIIFLPCFLVKTQPNVLPSSVFSSQYSSHLMIFGFPPIYFFPPNNPPSIWSKVCWYAFSYCAFIESQTRTPSYWTGDNSFSSGLKPARRSSINRSTVAKSSLPEASGAFCRKQSTLPVQASSSFSSRVVPAALRKRVQFSSPGQLFGFAAAPCRSRETLEAIASESAVSFLLLKRRILRSNNSSNRRASRRERLCGSFPRPPEANQKRRRAWRNQISRKLRRAETF